MKIVIRKHNPKSFEADPVDRPGACAVGRGRSIVEALGNFLLAYQEELGITIEIDESAKKSELNRRARELAKR